MSQTGIIRLRSRLLPSSCTVILRLASFVGVRINVLPAAMHAASYLISRAGQESNT